MKFNKSKIYDYIPGSTLLLFDENSYFKPDSSGYTEIGIVINKNKIMVGREHIFCIIEKKSLSKFQKIAYYPPSDKEFGLKVAKFFNFHWNDPVLRTYGFTNLMPCNREFWDGLDKLMPSNIVYKSKEEYEERWKTLISMLKIGDNIMTYDKKSLTSKLIAKVDGGIWSHCGMYLKEGFIHESITSGVTVSPIEVYHSQRYRVGIYRDKGGLTPEQIEIKKKRADSMLGEPYSYRTAIILGITKFFSIPLSTVPTPNSLAYSGLYDLIYYI